MKTIAAFAVLFALASPALAGHHRAPAPRGQAPVTTAVKATTQVVDPLYASCIDPARFPWLACPGQ